MPPSLSAAVPILRSFDETKAKDFYLGYLGFELGFERRFAPDMPLDFEISCGDCVLHISEHHGDATPGARIRIEVPDLGAYHAEITASGHPNARPGMCDQPWGNREMNIADPFGNTMTFWKPVKT